MRYKKQYLKSLGKRRVNRFSDIQYETMIDLLESATITKGNYQVKIQLPDGGATKLDSLLRQWQNKSHTIERNSNDFEVRNSDTKLVYKCGSSTGYKERVNAIYNSLAGLLAQGHIMEYGEDEKGTFIVCGNGKKFHLSGNFNIPNIPDDSTDQYPYGTGTTGTGGASSTTGTGSANEGSYGTGITSGNGVSGTDANDTAVQETSFFESNKTMIIILVAAVAVAGFIIFRK